MSDQQQRLAELQQQSAMQQLEIMRLREALKECVNDFADASQYKGDYFQEKHQDADTIAEYRKLLSTPTTYDDLMAWHEAQLGEPEAWFHEDYPAERYGDLEEFEYDYGSTDKARPLYAKKG